MKRGGDWICQDLWELSGGTAAEGEVPGAKRTARRLRKAAADTARTICEDSQYALLKTSAADGRMSVLGGNVPDNEKTAM